MSKSTSDAAAAKARADSVRGTTTSNVDPLTSTQNPTGPTQPFGSDSASAEPFNTVLSDTPDEVADRLEAEGRTVFRGRVNEAIHVQLSLSGEAEPDATPVWSSNAGNPSIGSQTDSGAVLVYTTPGTYEVTLASHNPDPVEVQAAADRGEKAETVTAIVIVESAEAPEA